MRLFDLFSNGKTINQQLEEIRNVPDAVLLDVRSSEEYRQGHIPGAINVDGNHIALVRKVIHDLNAPIYTYCLSGARSRRAVQALRQMGYTNVSNIGGINRYRGELAR